MPILPEDLEAVVFDLDGTLADTLPVVVEAFELTLDEFDLPPLSQSEIFEYFGPTEDGVINAMFGDSSPSAVPVFYTNYHKLLLANIVPFPGMRDLLRAGRDRGLRLAVVTGKSERGAAMTLEALDLVGLFEHVRGGSLRGVVKRREISGLLGIWEVQPDKAAYIGDHSIDIREARDAGVLALAAGWASTVDLEAIRDAQPDELFLTVGDFATWLSVDRSVKG
jgi:phosphoglycolate phosphatase/pyrophosphatase PpaX